MLTFEQFLHNVARKGQAVNLMFEERLFGLVEILHKVTDMFTAEHVPYELIGGMAVAARMEQVDHDAVMLTRDVDIMIHRSDLERVQETAPRHGFRFRHTAGLDMLLYGEEEKAVKGIHLVFSGETVKANQAPNPPIAPERIRIYDEEVSVITLVDLVRMKLNAFRDKDRVHVRAMDEIGMITVEIENKLSPELRSRLRHVRETE
jgi:hypothetical protein